MHGNEQDLPSIPSQLRELRKLDSIRLMRTMISLGKFPGHWTAILIYQDTNGTTVERIQLMKCINLYVS